MYIKLRNLRKNQRLGSFEGESPQFGGVFSKFLGRGRSRKFPTSPEGLANALTRVEMKKKRVEERRAMLEQDRSSGKLTEAQANRIEDRLNKQVERLAKREAQIKSKLNQQTMSGLGEWTPKTIGFSLAAVALGAAACWMICKKI